MPEIKKVKKVLRVGQEESSGLLSFVERPVPTASEVTNFERVIGRELREQEIDSNLDEIYSDRKGGRVDVKKMKVKKRPIFLVRFFRILLAITLLSLTAYFAYFYLFSNSNDISSMDFSISSPDNIIAGQEFSYQVSYHNPTKYPFSKLHLELQYPENFIFVSASRPPLSGNASWDLADLAAGENVTLTVTGQLIAPPDSANVIFGHLSYLPSSFTSQFKKDASFSTIISSLGFNVNLDSSGTAFLNSNNDLTLIFSEVKNNYLGDFNITFSLPEHASAAVVSKDVGGNSTSSAILTATSKPASTSSPNLVIAPDGGTSWRVSGLYPPIGRQEIPLTYKVTQESDKAMITVRLEKRFDNGQPHIFWEKTIQPQLVKSNLNLTLLLNNSKNDGAVIFGQPLNYSLTYANQDSNTYKDVVIMAALSGDFLDWNSLQAGNNGQTQNRTIVWTKNEVPGLAAIKSGDSGVLNFSLNLLPFTADDLGKKMSIVSYGQYSMDSQPISGESNKSNTITSQINSDLSLNEQIRYFDSNNIPVGSGPLPPTVGQTTSFRVHWTIKNSLHELTDTRVVLNLPAYITLSNNTVGVGSLSYNNSNNQVVWEVGRLPVSVSQVEASFNISLTPTEENRNKILVLSPGSTVTAMDTVTMAEISQTTPAKTTKLEDDDIAGLSNSGIVK
ncbi:MAG: hypothetical protein WC249_01410 [Patescibacteria group bacterium]|jgi:hypothetical protein